ncbi:ribonuclease III [Gammaproteobacteria bacterium]|nr:ribonuclease III [Gammaproteobacteria bacterium]
MIKYQILADKLNYQFSNPSLLTMACTHKSAGSDDNERLEFLGDAVLGCAISQMLFQRYAQSSEGTLSLMKSHLVSKKSLAIVARRIQLEQHILFNRKKTQKSPAVIANSMEAIFGAIFLDSGMAEASKVILDLYQPLIDTIDEETLKNPKNQLQETLQKKNHALPVYEIKSLTGSEHNLCFVVTCILKSHNLLTEGSGKSKKSAEEAAAKKMIEQLNEHAS